MTSHRSLLHRFGLFADDCLMYRSIRSSAVCEALQRDFDSLEWWSNAWGMKFNTKKCQVMSIAGGKLHPTYLYNFSAHILSSVQIAKCLWTTLTDEFSWSSHVHSIHSCANSALGFLRRNLRCCISKLKDCIHYVSPFYTGVCSVLNMWCERNPATDWQCEMMQIQFIIIIIIITAFVVRGLQNWPMAHYNCLYRVTAVCKN